ncbi:MAG: class I SAM-dependent methyltransferase [Iphinoe sp. HA4291-MV1]|jgi:SAM-dependent methyltransferase|nr:class I SAM-dependent methyltransferase [Iphinoe sp. HA4291-MV1]
MTKNHKLAEWLELRIPYDTTARNSIVEASCQQYLKKRKRVKIIDLGAGTGANCRYYLSKISQEQEWFLVEQNQELLEIAFDRLIVWAQENRYESQLQNSRLVLKNQVYQITIHRIVGSILDLENLIDLNTLDLAVANAVFDLFSEKQFQTLLECLKKYQLPFLATLNYTGTNFIPQTDNDSDFIQYYNQHMQRHQYFGRGMGPECGPSMWEAMKRIGMKVIQGESPWEITSSDPVFLQLLLRFMEESIPEILEEATLQDELNNWLLEKQQMIAQNKLSCNVAHQDFWGEWE